MSEVMLVLAREWIIGVSVCISICILGYLVFSILLVRHCRKYKYDIGVSAFVPLVNLVIWFKSRKYKKALMAEPLISEDEEFEL